MEAGKRIGNYVVEEPLGRGGMGVVYRGRHATLPRVVAIKSISPRGTHDLRRLRNRFEREAFVQAQLDHPGIVKIYDYVVSEQTYYIVMEYVEGRSLAQLIARERSRLTVERALDLFEQMLEAIAYAHGFVYRDAAGATHRGIVHRDLKPPNIMITPDDRIKVTDFGIVKLVGATTTDTSNVIYGSPRYVSPEQAEGETLDQRSDIYSLGVILYEMLAGEPPFGGRVGEGEKWTRTEILRAHREQAPRPPSELNDAIPPEIEKIVCRALEKKPERRLATAGDFLRALRRARGRDAGEPPRAVTVETPRPDDTGALGETTDDLLQDAYHTQPIVSEVCPDCGAEVEAGAGACPSCGRELSAASPATSKLTRRDSTARQDGRGVRLAAAAALLLTVLALLVYLVRLQGWDAPRPAENVAPDAAPAAKSEAQATAADASAPKGAVRLLQPQVSVDSSFDGYGAKPLTDGVTDVREVGSMRYNQGNWVSAENPEAHWIELGFARPARVTAVYVFWGFDRDRYMPSRSVELQAADEGGANWRTISRLEPGGNYDRAAFEFEPLVTERLRVFQPPQGGPPNRPFVMWVREVQAFGTQGE